MSAGGQFQQFVHKTSPAELFILGILVSLVALFCLPIFLTRRAIKNLEICKTNIKTIATAVELYAHNAGQYPPSLQRLVETSYLPGIPTCPSAGTVTYGDYVVEGNPQVFSFGCRGNNHPYEEHLDTRNCPGYHSTRGLFRFR